MVTRTVALVPVGRAAASSDVVSTSGLGVGAGVGAGVGIGGGVGGGECWGQGDGAAADLDEGVAAALVDGAGVAFPVDHGRLGEDVDGGFDDGSGFGVEPQPVLGDPAADVVPTGEDGQPAVPVLDVLQQLAEAVLGEHGRPDPADSGGAVDLPHGDQPGGDGVDRAPLEERGQLPQLGGDDTARGHRQPPLLDGDSGPRQYLRLPGTGRVGELADRLGDHARVAGVQGRAPVGHPLGRGPGLRRGDLTPRHGVGGDREPARRRNRDQPVHHRKQSVHV